MLKLFKEKSMMRVINHMMNKEFIKIIFYYIKKFKNNNYILYKFVNFYLIKFIF